ncbi:MAG: nucleotide exchange factor GrpE [Bdellovibrionales bacterium]
MKKTESDNAETTTENSTNGTPETPVVSTSGGDLEQRVQELEAALAKERNDALYARAEFDNFRKRAVKERSELVKYGGERALADILTVMDNFERAIRASETANIEDLKKGVVMIAEDLRNTLKRYGITEVLPENGKFDPTIFEAISTEETDEVEPGQISRIFRNAYKFHDKIIRPGQVIIAKAKATDGEKG